MEENRFIGKSDSISSKLFSCFLCSLWQLVVSLFGSYRAAEADDCEDEDPEELSAPESYHHDVVVVHGPQSTTIGREERAVARSSVGGEEHRAAGDQDGELEEESEEGAVGLRDATDSRPAAPDAKQPIDDE